MDVTSIKQRFDIIGTSPLLDRALSVACQVAPTDLSVLITGESGVGKEKIPQVIHQQSARRHAKYIAVNCGAIPEGTIDSELFGHEKGSFTGAVDARKGYFEEADGGTLFLDEVAELPLSTQVRLLRVLESGEFIRVGSSKPQRTDVRVVAATNVNIPHAIRSGKFREDLYYRLNAVPLYIPPLRERPEDIHLLFRKFAADFADKYKVPVIRLRDDALALVRAYRWPGNVRQLKNVAEQLSVLEHDRNISAAAVKQYLPEDGPMHLPVVKGGREGADPFSERDLLYKVIFQLRAELDQIRGQVHRLMEDRGLSAQGDLPVLSPNEALLASSSLPSSMPTSLPTTLPSSVPPAVRPPDPDYADWEEAEDLAPAAEPLHSTDLSLNATERDLITRALRKHKGHRKSAAQELGISERTLYRKIKEFGL